MKYIHHYSDENENFKKLKHKKCDAKILIQLTNEKQLEKNCT